jgi:glutathione S-transferase
MENASRSVILRYFDCRSRGQALRFALSGAGVPFEDERVPVEELAAWRARTRESRSGGPFASLPVLEWEGHQVAQTLAIASYLAAKLGYDDVARTPEARSVHDMLVSAAHLDLQLPYSALLWLPRDCSENRLRRTARGLLAALRAGLSQLEAFRAELADPGPCFGGQEPAMSDYFVCESLARAVAVFGEPFAAALARSRRMRDLYDAVEARPGVARCLSGGHVPERVTASPSEPDLRCRIRDLAERGELRSDARR